VSQPANYPDASEADVALRDGSTLHIRPVAAEDRPAIDVFLRDLSQESVGFRFFGAVNLEWVAEWAVDVDYADRYALVAVTGPERRIVAHAAYVHTGPGSAGERAEVAFLVADAWQGHGIATLMLAHLAAAAQAHGIETFTAEVLPHNHRMIEVFRESGFPVELRSSGEALEIELPTSLSAAALERFERREQTAAVAAVKSFLCPHAVAVVGASRRRRTVGAEVLRNLLAHGYTGAVYPVNSRAHTVQGRRAYASVDELPERVDLAVLAVPAAQVVDVARDCGAAGVRALLVLSAGFAEAGAEGAARQYELLEVCRETGMRLVGPNCQGVLNTAPDVRLDATFASGAPLEGRVGLLSQSGGLGLAILEAAGRLGLGVSSFASVGNKADVSGNDLLQYWEQDPRTDVVGLYLESFGNPRRFARVARRVSAVKPVVAVKSGRSAPGSRAPTSHAGALVAASDVTVDALFRQAGVVRTDTVHELLDVVSLLCAQPPPRGPRVAIVTNAGGPGALCADACRAGGLEVPPLEDRVRRRLAGFLAPEASTGNPINMLATADAADYRRVVEVCVEEGACDAVVAVFVPALATAARDVARELRAAARRAGGVTLSAVFMTGDGASRELTGGDPPTPHTPPASRPAATSRTLPPSRTPPASRTPPPPSRTSAPQPRVPTYYFPEDAARALAHAARYARWRERPQGAPPKLEGCRPEAAAAIVAAATITSGEGWLPPGMAAALLRCYGLPLSPTSVVADPGVELLVGVVHDESFGPVVACGAGGVNAELQRDVAVRTPPLTDVDAAEMVRSLRTYPLLEGYGGTPRCDVAAVEDVLLRLSALVEGHPEIAELDAPVIAGPAGATIVDARVCLAPAPPRPLLSALGALPHAAGGFTR
jgi:acetate---CoA ligase (ADP-forming)